MGTGYDAPADLILVTHSHSDHTVVHLIETKNKDCTTITYAEALVEGKYKIFDMGYVTVEAVQAGNNPNHNINVCVGFVLTFSDGVSIYISGDTSKTDQMAELAKRKLDYAFFCCDGRFNMGIEEAIECANLVNAKHSVPYHIAPGTPFNKELAETFTAKNRLIIAAGETVKLVHYIPKLLSVIPYAYVQKLSGNTNNLIISVTEYFDDGSSVSVKEMFTIKNNSDGTFKLGKYNVYVDTKGNDQIRACRLEELFAK